jgi:hypothetical protein
VDLADQAFPEEAVFLAAVVAVEGEGVGKKLALTKRIGEGEPMMTRTADLAVDTLIRQQMESNCDVYQGRADVSIYDDYRRTDGTVGFNLFTTMLGITQSLEAGALGKDRDIFVGETRNGTFLYRARFVTQRIGESTGKTIIIFDNLSSKELFSIDVLPSVSTSNPYSIKGASTYPGGRNGAEHKLTTRDNALLQHLSAVLRQRANALR